MIFLLEAERTGRIAPDVTDEIRVLIRPNEPKAHCHPDRIAHYHRLIADRWTDPRISLPDILGRSRTRRITDRRAMVIAWLRATFHNLSLCFIGGILNRDHSTIIYTLEKHEGLIKNEYDYRAEYNRRAQ
jgi:chromosomal replication initiation ATPase DnaA